MTNAENNRLLFRQVHPSWIQNGRPSSQTFMPTPKDEYKLSVFDSALISAANCYEYYTSALKLSSVGLVGVTVEELHSTQQTFTLDGVPIPSHGYIDFNGLSNGQTKRVAQTLQGFAAARPWPYKP